MTKAYTNLFRDGHEAVASSVMQWLGKRAAPQSVFISKDGTLRVISGVVDRPGDTMVGIYTKRATIEQIKDDLVVVWREMTDEP